MTTVEKSSSYKGYTYHILLRQSFMSEHHRCGYVEIPEDHPFFDKDYFEIEDENPSIEVHGGLTFSEDSLLSEGPNRWFIGFDCAHAGDKIEDWSLENVEIECKKLIDQL